MAVRSESKTLEIVLEADPLPKLGHTPVCTVWVTYWRGASMPGWVVNDVKLLTPETGLLPHREDPFMEIVGGDWYRMARPSEQDPGFPDWLTQLVDSYLPMEATE